MSRRFTYSAILVVALPLIAAAGFLYARGTGGYELATGHKSISHEAPPRTIDPRIVRQMPLADASSQIYELWQREGLQGFTGMRFDNDKGEVILYWKGQVPHRMVALVRTLRTSVPVRVVERPYSLVELQREAKRLVELDLSGAGVNVTQAGPLPDFWATLSSNSLMCLRLTCTPISITGRKMTRYRVAIALTLTVGTHGSRAGRLKTGPPHTIRMDRTTCG